MTEDRELANMSSPRDEWIRPAEAVALLKPMLSESSARLRICQRAHVGLVRAHAEQYHLDARVNRNVGIPQQFWWAEGHEALEQDWASGDFSTWIDRRFHLRAFGVTFARTDIEKLVPTPTGIVIGTAPITDDDARIISELGNLVPSAGLSYQQAVHDLQDDKRVSFRGPVLELREAMREILDHLAADAEVTAQTGYIQVAGRNGPTMKQKVRFILKKKGNRSIGDAPELAAETFEEAVAGLTRAVYELSSKATHVAIERQTVDQLRRYVVVILHDILP